jgi:hypothetical protein
MNDTDIGDKLTCKEITMADHDIIGFCSYLEKGQQWYGCRGIGETYRQFYTWLRDTPIVNERDDWPWHYFVFAKPEDEQNFVQLWGDKYGID